MSEIRTGDLVVVIKPTPCCGNTSYIGRISTVVNIDRTWVCCGLCGSRGMFTFADTASTLTIDIRCLKKIDPLAEDDSLPIRRDLEVVA